MAKATSKLNRKIWTWVQGSWRKGSPPVLSPNMQAMWLSSVVFDGARSLAGHMADLDLHCARVNGSALALGMEPTHSIDEIECLSREGVMHFDEDAELYICPMYYAEEGFITPEPGSTQFVLSIYESPLPVPSGFKACRSTFRRPAPDQAPTEAKASCLYPNVARSVLEARQRGYDTGVVMDPMGHVAEFSYTNLFYARDNVVHTPVPNGTFLNGITRQRIIQLLREDGIQVYERVIEFEELLDADEVFGTGNYSKVMPCVRLDDRPLQVGPLYNRARELYFTFSDNN